MRKHPKDGLKFQKLELDAMKIVVYSDGSFRNNNDASSQAWYQIFLADKNNDANIIDFEILKPRRVGRYALGAETSVLADACDASIIMQNDLLQMLKKTLKLFILKDSENRFNVIIRSWHTTEKRLMIDMKKRPRIMQWSTNWRYHLDYAKVQLVWRDNGSHNISTVFRGTTKRENVKWVWEIHHEE